MGRYFSLAMELPPTAVPARNKNKKTAPLSIKKSNFGLWILIILILFGINYLLLVNSSTTKGYEIKKLEKRILELKESSNRLEIETGSLKSIQNLEETAKTLNLIPSLKVDYLKSSGYAYDN